MDFYQTTHTPNTPAMRQRSESMAMASLILGLTALLSSGCIYFATVCGSLGIILALLSKGGCLSMNAKGKIGLILSSAGLILTLLIYIGALIFLLNYYGGFDNLMQQYQNLYQADSIEELYRSMNIM